MESCLEEVEDTYEATPLSDEDADSGDSDSLVIEEESDLNGEDPQSSEIAPGNARKIRERQNFDEYKKICIHDFLLKKLTYAKLKHLMEMYHTDISNKRVRHLNKSISEKKMSKAMSKTIIMFHLMFSEIKENVTLNSIYYQMMSDLISMYIDFEIKASENSLEPPGALSSRVTYVMEQCLDKQHRFMLDTLLKSYNICNKFQEISTLLISRVVRDLPSTEYSEHSFIRSILVFKKWMKITKDEERAKILKLASHLVKPPKELIEKPSEFAKEILPCNFHKCYIDIVSYIIGTPWPLHKKTQIFLKRTRIEGTPIFKESVLKSSSTSVKQKNEEISQLKGLRKILSGLRDIIIMERKSKELKEKIVNYHYKYSPKEELNERTALSFDLLKKNRSDVSTQTFKSREESGKFNLPDSSSYKFTEVPHNSNSSYNACTPPTSFFPVLHNHCSRRPSFSNVAHPPLFNKQFLIKNSSNASIPGYRQEEYLMKKLSLSKIGNLPSQSSGNNFNPLQFDQLPGMGTIAPARDWHCPINQSHPVAFNQLSNRPNNSLDNVMIMNSGPPFVRTQNECQSCADPYLLMEKNVRPHCSLHASLHSGNKYGPLKHNYQTSSRSSGNMETSIAPPTYTHQSSGTLANNMLNPNSATFNPPLPTWHVNPTSEYYNSFTTSYCEQIPNSISQSVLTPPHVLNPKTIQNDPHYGRLPPYSSIRKKCNVFNPALTITNSSLNNLPVNSNLDSDLLNNVCALPVPITTNQSSLPVINDSCSSFTFTASSLTHTNDSVGRPGISASTSFTVPETNSEVMRLNSHGLYLPPSQLSHDFYFSASLLAENLLIHKNDLGFAEYNFKKMPIPLNVFPDSLNLIEENNSNIKKKNSINEIVAKLSETNQNFVNEENMHPPRLLRVNSNNRSRGKFYNAKALKEHVNTLKTDQLSFAYQEKVLQALSRFNYPSTNDSTFKSDVQHKRCCCLQCFINTSVLRTNAIILTEFSIYQHSSLSAHFKENEKNLPLNMAINSKRYLERSSDEVDSPLPLKKRITSTPPREEAPSTKESEISYPSTPMMSIAQFEPLKNISANTVERTTYSINDDTCTAASDIPNSVVSPQPSEISQNIYTYKPVSEAATLNNLEHNESEILPGNDSDNSLHAEICQEFSSSESIQSSISSRRSRKKRVPEKLIITYID